MNDDCPVEVDLRRNNHKRFLAFGKKGILPASALVLQTDLDNNLHGGCEG